MSYRNHPVFKDLPLAAARLDAQNTIEVQAGARQSLVVERRVDTVIIRQGENAVSLDEWYVRGLREALYALAPREVGP